MKEETRALSRQSLKLQARLWPKFLAYPEEQQTQLQRRMKNDEGRQSAKPNDEKRYNHTYYLVLNRERRKVRKEEAFEMVKQQY
jgi:hypothetical protein